MYVCVADRCGRIRAAAYIATDDRLPSRRRSTGMYVCTVCMYVCTVCMYEYVGVYVCMYVCTVCMYVYVGVYVCMCMYVYEDMYVYVCTVCMYVRMYVLYVLMYVW